MDDQRSPERGPRPISSPVSASRFPSLRRTNVPEPYRHRSLPPEPSANSDGSESEVTFAVLYDDGPDYELGHYDELGSIQTGHHRDNSLGSFTPSFQTHDSRMLSHEHLIGRHMDQVANDRSLMGTPSSISSSPLPPRSHLSPTPSQETINTKTRPAILSNEKLSSSIASAEVDTPDRKRRGSWCTCDEDIDTPVQDEKNEVDVEAQSMSPTRTPSPRRHQAGLDAGSMAFQVKWDGPSDPTNPMNWQQRQKWAATACIAAFTFVSPLASTIVAPALPNIRKDFEITNLVESQIVLSIFVLAFAIGPMFLGPLSELYGRAIVSQGSNVFFLVFNTLCGFATSKGQLMAFRFLAGLGGSAPLALGGGVIGDIFKPEERGKAMGLYAMGPLLGPALGPVIGGWIAEKSTWRWMFWAVSLVNFVIFISSLIWFRETYAPYLLHLKAKKARRESGNPAWRADGEAEVDQPVWKKISNTMSRAFSMLFTQPIVQVMSLYMGLSYGILYLMLSSYSELFMVQYNQSIGVSGLNYISLGLGFFIGAPVCGKSSDVIYKRLTMQSGLPRGKPEYRMPVIVPFSFLVPVGLLVYGWSAQTHTHWFIPNIGAFLFGIGTIAAFQCVTAYLIDTYARFAASSIAAVTILRSLMGFGFPLFAPAMYNALDYGWGNTVLAIVAIVLGVPVPILLWLFGEKLRKGSSLAMSAKPAGRPAVPVCPLKLGSTNMTEKSLHIETTTLPSSTAQNTDSGVSVGVCVSRGVAPA